MTIFLGISDGPFLQSSSGLHAEYTRSVTASAPQGSVLSPIFFNVAISQLLFVNPADQRFPVHCSIYVEDIVLWTSGLKRNLCFVRTSLRH